MAASALWPRRAMRRHSYIDVMARRGEYIDNDVSISHKVIMAKLVVGHREFPEAC